MPTTTAAAIREQMVGLIVGLTPAYDSAVPFVPSTSDRHGNIRSWSRANPSASTRRFQVRSRVVRQWTDITNTDVEAVLATFEIVVAYAQTHRWGPDAALDRDDVIESDQSWIEQTVGRDGYANISNASWLGPNAAGSETATIIERDDAAGVDFLVITQTMRFFRARLAPNVVGTKEDQVFRYTAIGNEGDLVTISLPQVRRSTNYNVQAQYGGPSSNAIKLITPLVSSFLTSQFQVALSADAEAGDIFMFTVEDVTT